MKESSKMRLIDIVILLGIIGILATIGLPAYQSNMNRAKAYEAEITLEVARNILLSYYQQKGNFPIAPAPIKLIDIKDIEIDSFELSGKYYQASDYFYISDPDGNSFKIKATGTKPGMESNSREIDETGQIRKTTTF